MQTLFLVLLAACTGCRQAVVSDNEAWPSSHYQTVNETSAKLINADFENTSKVCPFYDDEIVGWVIPPSSSKGELKLIGPPEILPHSGSNCLAMSVLSPTADGNMRTIGHNLGKIPARKGDVFEVSIWCKGSSSASNSTPAGLSVVLYSFAKGDQLISGQWFGKIYIIPPPSAWTLLKDKITIQGENAEYVRLSLDLWGTNTVYCDDVVLEKIEDRL